MKRALVAAIAAALTTAAVLSASGLGATPTTKAKARHHARHAQTLGATGSQGAQPTGPPPTMAQAFADMQKLRDAQDKKLADALGVSVDKLHSAFDAVQAKHLADDVKNNRLTQAQADAIKACKKAPLTCDRSNLPAFGGRGFGGRGFGGRGFGGHGGMRGPGGPGGDRANDLTDLASALGVSTDKLKTVLQANRPQGHGFGGHDGGGPDNDGPPGGGPGGGMQGGSYGPPPATPGTGA